MLRRRPRPPGEGINRAETSLLSINMSSSRKNTLSFLKGLDYDLVPMFLRNLNMGPASTLLLQYRCGDGRCSHATAPSQVWNTAFFQVLQVITYTA